MTSSLVGSEMCIRDRSPPVLLAVESDDGRLHHQAGPQLSSATPAEAGACLLYTSDAADDM
eukprot:8769402-Prorocentrum_lima.AAC.1